MTKHKLKLSNQKKKALETVSKIELMQTELEKMCSDLPLLGEKLIMTRDLSNTKE